MIREIASNSDEERRIWERLEQQLAPLVVGDKLGDVSGVLPNLQECAWASLYALGILITEWHQQKLNSALSVDPQPTSVKWRRIEEEFLALRKKQIAGFKSFLHSWRLDHVFGIPRGEKFDNNKWQWENDERVLGYHSFASIDDVGSYVLRWRENLEIAKMDLFYHRMVTSRGIDVVCSELLSNAFDHSGTVDDRRNVFVMAKLCSPESSAIACAIHAKRNHLTEVEFAYYKRAKEANHSILQLVIGDCGHGFGGNNALRDLYGEMHNQAVKEESALIEFALLPEVSTRLLMPEIEDEWEKYLEGIDAIDPIIHGLSEVALSIREMGGYWRIHSNDTVIEHDYSQISPLGGKGLHRSKGRAIHGCLHYVMVALPKERPAVHFKSSNTISRESLVLVDAGEIFVEARNKPLEKFDREDWRSSVVLLCREIHKQAAKRSIPMVLIDLAALDALPVVLNNPVFALLADTLHRLRSRVPVFITGASDRTRSTLKRYQGMQRLFFDRRVLPFVKLHQDDSEFSVEVECGNQLEKIKEYLNAALSPMLHNDIQLSDHPDDAHLFHEVANHNEGLYHIFKIGDRDFGFDGRVKINGADGQARRLLLGGRSSKEFLVKIQQHRALDHANFLRLGEVHTEYIHLGRLWSDQECIKDITLWISIALQNILRNNAEVDSSVSDWRERLNIVALLHPAIDLAHGLAGHPLFRHATITEIRRVGDMRWDSTALLTLAGERNVVCLVDIIDAGTSAARLLEQLSFIGATPLAVMAVLTTGRFTAPVPIVAFSQCAREQFANLELKK